MPVGCGWKTSHMCHSFHKLVSACLPLSMRLGRRISFVKDCCNMRIRRYRQEDLPSLVHIYHAAAQADGTEMMNDAEFEAWLTDPEADAVSNAVVITDDDDELNPWGQAGTLD